MNTEKRHYSSVGSLKRREFSPLLRKNSVTASPSPARLRSASLDERGLLPRPMLRRSMTGDHSVTEAMPLEEVCRGDCLNFVEVVRREPSASILASVINEEASEETVSALTNTEDEEQGSSSYEGLGMKQERLKKKRKRMTGDEALRDLFLKVFKDLVASIVVFFLCAVIYVSGAHSILAPYYNGAMTQVALKTFLAGSATVGLVFAFFSSVPWAVGAVDVGFLPLLGHLAQICYRGVVIDGGRHRSSFAATYILAQSTMFIFAGVALLLLGYFRLTKLSNYLPYPVVAGLLASIGVSLAKSGISVASSAGFKVSYVLGLAWLSLALVLTFVSHYLKRHIHLPGYITTPIVVIGATILLWFTVLFFDFDQNLHYYGILFKQESQKADDTYWIYSPNFFSQVDFRVALWGESRSVFMAATVIGALKIGIKCGSFSAMFPTASMDVDHEVQLAGASHLLGGLLGFAGQAHSFSGIKVQQQLQASTRAASFLVAFWCLIAWQAGIGPLLSIIPRFVFGALLIELGIDYVHTYLIYPMRLLTTFSAEEGREAGNLDIVDCATLISIVITALLTNLLEAVALGLVLSLVGVSRRLAQRSIISRIATGRAIRSTIERPPKAMRVLEKLGDAVTIVELVGYIFFGSAQELVDLVVDRIGTEKSPQHLRHLVLDVSRCFAQFDVTAIAAFEKILAIAHLKEFRVAFAPSDSDSALALDRGLQACSSDTVEIFEAVALWFHTVDDALEYCEDDLLNDATLIESASKQSLASSGMRFSSPHRLASDIDSEESQEREEEEVTQEILDDPEFGLGVDLSATDSENEKESEDRNENTADEEQSALTALSGASARYLKKKQLLKSWLDASSVPLETFGFAQNNSLDRFIDILATILTISHAATLTDTDGEKVIALLVDGRVRLLNADNMCVRKLTEGSCVGVGDFYVHDPTSGISSDPFTLVPNSPHITFLQLKHTRLTQLESDHPDIAIAFHKLMARSLAQKNRNSKLQHRTD